MKKKKKQYYELTPKKIKLAPAQKDPDAQDMINQFKRNGMSILTSFEETLIANAMMKAKERAGDTT